MDQPTSLSQLLRESYLAESRAHHRHGEPSCIDASRRLVYGTLKEKEEPQFPDLSAFLSQEELDNSVDLACKAISSDPREREERSDAHPPTNLYNLPSHKPTPEAEVISERQTVPTPIQDNAIRNVRSAADFKRPQRDAPYGFETQSKKEFLNKAADFIEELSSLFKSNSSKRIRPRTCKPHRSRCRNKTQLDAEDRERPLLLSQQMEERGRAVETRRSRSRSRRVRNRLGLHRRNPCVNLQTSYRNSKAGRFPRAVKCSWIVS